MSDDRNICVIGLGFVGLPLAATFADLGFTVTGVDKAPHILESLKNGKAHFAEEGLQELLDKTLGKNLTVADRFETGAHDVYIIAVGTPVNEETKKPIMEYVEQASAEIGKALKKGDLVVMRSTVPVGTTRDVVIPHCEKESGLKAGEDFDVVFAPERLVAGKAIAELKELPQIIGGLTGTRDVERSETLFKKMTPKIVITENIEAAEMGKLIDNTYRDFHFAYANQMALLCEKLGIDAPRLIKDVNRDYKRNRIPTPSPGVGGICLMKDPYLMMSIGDVPLTETARGLNEDMPKHVAARVLKTNPSTVFILGFAFKGKPETSDTRVAPTTDVVQELQKSGCRVLGYDPVVPHEKLQELSVTPATIEEGFAEANAVIIMTNHTAFESMDISSLANSMKKPAVLYDGWHLFDPETLRDVSGVTYIGTGF